MYVCLCHLAVEFGTSLKARNQPYDALTRVQNVEVSPFSAQAEMHEMVTLPLRSAMTMGNGYFLQTKLT